MPQPSRDVTLTPARPEDAPELVAFHNRMYGTHCTPDFWLWKYRDHMPGKSVYVVALSGGNVVGTQGMIPICLRTATGIELTGKSENSLLAPALRGTGVWGRVYEHAVELCRQRGMKAVWGFTRARKVLTRSSFAVHDVLVQSLGVLHVFGGLGVVWRSSRTLCSKLAISLALPGAVAYGAICRLVRRTSPRGLAFEPELRDETDIARMYDRVRKIHPELIHIEYDSEYLGWRLDRHPLFRFRTYFVYRRDELAAYAIVNDRNRVNPAIVDFGFDDRAAGQALLERVTRDLSNSGAGIVTFFANRTNPLGRELLNIAAERGFYSRAAANAFVVRDLSNDKELERPERWHFSALWFEGYTI